MKEDVLAKLVNDMHRVGLPPSIVSTIFIKALDENKSVKDIVEKLKLKSVEVPNIAFRIVETDEADKAIEEGIKPRKFEHFDTEAPKTIFLHVPSKVMERFRDKGSEKEFKNKFKDFIETRSGLKRYDTNYGVSITHRVADYAIELPEMMSRIKAINEVFNELKEQGLAESSKEILENEEHFNKFVKAYEKKKGEILEKPKKLSILVINLDKIPGDNHVMIPDIELYDSGMLFKKVDGKIKPVEIPPEAIEKIDIGEIGLPKSVEEKDKIMRKVLPKIESAYISKLIENIARQDVKEAIGKGMFPKRKKKIRRL